MTIQETRPRPTSVYDLEIEVSPCDRDRQLVLGFLAGDVDAFAVIAHEHYPALAAQARRLLGSSGQPEDAVQETLERAMKGLKRFGLTGEYRLGPWLGRILANVCNDQRARASRQFQAVQNVAARPSLEDDIADRIGDPKTIDAVRSALLELPQTHRRAVVLHELEGLPYADVAEAENISVENARARVSRGKSTLRRSLGAMRGVILLPVLRVFGKGLPFARGKAISAPGGELQGVTAPSLVDQIAGRLAASPIGQSALAFIASPPKGTIVLGLAATVATVSASTVLLTQPATQHSPPAAVSTVAAPVVLTPPVNPVSPAPTAAAPLAAPAAGTIGAANGSAYTWVDPGSGSPGAAGVPIATLPVATCTSENGISPPGPGFSPGPPLGMSDAVSVGSTPTAALPTTGPNLNLSGPLSVSLYGQTGGTTFFNMAASACLSSSGWFTASLTGTGSAADVDVQLTGVVQSVLGSNGDLGYVFRGTVSSPGEPNALLAGDQFVAQLIVAEPANTAQLTIVFLQPGADEVAMIAGQGDSSAASSSSAASDPTDSTASGPAGSDPSTSTSGSSMTPASAPSTSSTGTQNVPTNPDWAQALANWTG